MADAVTIRLRGALSLREHSALAQLQALPQQVEHEGWRRVALDVSELTAADSLLFAALFSALRALRQSDCQLDLLGLPERLRVLAQAYGIEELLES